MRNISQEDLAHICQLDRSYMGRVERGVVRITLEKVYRIAIALDCDLADLLPSLNTPNIFDREA